MILVNPRTKRHANAAWAQPNPPFIPSWTATARVCYRKV
jgi:hypothetical protein